MSNTMNASQVRKLMEGYHKATIENELKKIKKGIEEAVANGDDYMRIHKIIGHDTKIILENLGYYVELVSNEDTVVTW